MSRVEHIVSEALANDVVLYLKDGQLAYSASGNDLQGELREKIVANKAALVEYLEWLNTVDDDIDALLSTLAERGVEVYVDGGTLKTRGEPGAIDAPLAARIREHKQAIIARISTESVALSSAPIDEGVLSFGQQRLWFLDRFQQGGNSYNIPVTLRLTGDLDRGALRQSLEEIVRRHAVLRSVYATTPSGPVQVARPAAPFDLPVADLRVLPAADRAKEVDRLAQAEVNRPFDLSNDLMIRAVLAQVADDTHVLYVTIHHIAADGWSLGVLVKEMMALYEAFVRRMPHALLPIEYPYAEYARWQREFCQGEQVERELTYWREALAGVPKVHRLPLDRPRPLHQNAEGGMVPGRVDAQIFTALRKLAQKNKCTLFMVLHAAFALLLGRWGDEQDLVIGTPVAGRTLPKSEPLIGLFINTLALRLRLSRGLRFEALLQQSRSVTLQAYEHQNTPFEMLVEALNPPRSLSHTPLYQVMFALQNFEFGALALPDLTVDVLANEHVSARFDLTLMAVERDGGLAMSWVYAKSLFDAGTIESMVASYITLLRAIVADPQSDIYELPLLDPEQVAEVTGLARSAGGGRIVCDAMGRVQPVGAAGRIQPLDADGQEVSAEGAVGRMRADGAIERIEAAIAPTPPTMPIASTMRDAALERQLSSIWREVLGNDEVGIHDNFFDIGGSSMQSIVLQQEIQAKLGREISVTDIFAYPTVATLARYLVAGDDPVAPRAGGERTPPGHDVAIIGMAGRFPDAGDVDAFWENIRRGVESLRQFTDDELRQAGASEALLANPAYVKSGVLLDAIEDFDAAYFGFTSREAEITDPQHRVLLECADEALEDAGYGGDGRPRSVGVFVGVGTNQYFLRHLLPRIDEFASLGEEIVHANNKDYHAATRISYKLNLDGPSMCLNTACSTSLVAVHEACKSLLQGDCAMALAGGANIVEFYPGGYLHGESDMRSADGHCRPFDRQASGTRRGNGAGLVLLKRLDAALADGDPIHAVIKGTAVNNDGAGKAGYTAPSMAGQTKSMRAALEKAGVAPSSIQYVEAHGTATPLGDPIEVRSLSAAFGELPAGSCALGSVKANVGHLEIAAGMSSLVKVVQALKHRAMPPQINFEAPNPHLGLAQSLFYVNTHLQAWACDGPRRATVSAFGLGGTNAHAVLEEAPATGKGQSHRPVQLLVLSARSEAALQAVGERLAAHLQRADVALGDVAHTLHVGRARHACRRAVVCDSAAGAIAQLSVPEASQWGEVASVVLMFADAPAPYEGLGGDLYDTEPAFRAHVDRCVALFPAAAAGDATAHLRVFAFEYSLAQLLLAWGVTPAAVVGKGVGAFAAACVAGVWSLEDALALVALRAVLLADPVAPGAKATWREALDRVATHAACLPWIPDAAVEDLEATGMFDVRQTVLAESAASAWVVLGSAQAWVAGIAGGEPSTDHRQVIALATDSVGEESSSLQRVIGELWLAGVDIDWMRYHADERCRRVWLPTYPFERTRHWVDPPHVTPTSVPAVPVAVVPDAYVAHGEDDMEQWLLGVWHDLLGGGPIQRDDDFFDLGGNSLLVTRMLNRIRERFPELDQPYSISSFFEAPTIAGTSESLRAARASALLRRQQAVREKAGVMVEGLF